MNFRKSKFEKIKNLKISLQKKFLASGLNKKIRQAKAFFKRYHHIWKLSEARKILSEKLNFFWRKISSFNFLNSSALVLALFFKKLGFRKFSEKIEFSMQEKSGINRHILVRYLMKELFLYFFVAFLFFFMVFFVNQILLVAENILKKRVPVMDVMRLITYSLPMIIAQSAPFATLVGFLMCMGRLASDNEILILRASGQSYILTLVSVLFMGLLISIASFFVNDYLLPLGNLNYSKLYRSILSSNPAVELEPNSVKRTNDKTLVIGQVDGENVSDIIFFDTDSDGNQRIIIAGNSTVRKSETSGVLMNLLMDDASVLIFNQNKKNDYDVMLSENMELNIFDSVFFQDNNNISPREMTSYDLAKQIKILENKEGTTKKMMNRYKLEMAKKFSLPFGSIFFAFLALPLALILGKHNGQTIGLVIGLFISVFYWAVNILGQIFSSRSGLHGVFVMWLPNILIGIAGIIFYWRLVRK